MKPLGLMVAAALILLSLSVPRAAETPDPPERWEKEIAAFERSDKTNAPPPDAVLFVGSSSLRLWTNLAQAFPNERVLNRGFGGSTVRDSLHFADRIILPYRPRAIVLYAGDNDLAKGLPPEAVLADFQALVAKIEKTLPAARIGFIAIKPSTARWKLIEKIRQANALVAAFARDHPRVEFIDIFQPMLNADGQPRPELLAADGLHINHAGYEIWARQIQKFLQSTAPGNN
jgi:lysophospholipase L1-like esterase